MIYTIDGHILFPYNSNGIWDDAVFDTIGNQLSLNTVFNENFNAFDTSIWSCKSGNYHGWQYLPVDYSDNAFAEDGNLIIRNLKNNPTEQFEWSGAYAETREKYEFRYGIIAIRMKFPSDADNYHATFWLVGSGNIGGEIDVAEADSGDVTAALHWYEKDTGKEHLYTFGSYGIDAKDYHVYLCYWDTKRISMYCDGTLLGVFYTDNAIIDGYNPFSNQFYLILNTNPYSTQYDEYATSESVTNYIDWIRIYSN